MRVRVTRQGLKMTRSPNAAPVLHRDLDIPLRGQRPEAMIVLGPGAYVRADEWSDLFIDGRLRTRAAAVDARLVDERGAFGYTTALAIHDIPVLGGRDDRVDYIVGDTCGRHNARDVRRRHELLPAADVVIVGGFRVTTLERAIYDVIRLGSLEMAVVAFDAALYRTAWNEADNSYDERAAEVVRSRVLRRIREHSGARGIRQARFVAAFADGRARLPGESLLRLRLWQFGVLDAVPQYRVDFEGARYALLDLALPAWGRWLEFDGAVKYSDDEMLADRTAQQTLADQARRQAAIERVTGWRCDRAVWADVLTLDGFARFRRSIALYA